MKTIDTNTLNNGDGQRNINKYKEKAAYLFQKLNNLQKNAEANKSQNQKILFEDFNQTEHVALESTKLKEGWYSHIISMITQIQNELSEQKNQQQKCKRAVRAWVQSTERQLSQAFEKLQKQKLKGQAALEKFIESKIQSTILKNKNLWTQGNLINKQPYLQEILYLTKEHKRFLSQMQKQCDKLRKQSFSLVKQYSKCVEEQVNNNDQEQITNFMRTVHMDITSKLTCLRQQRDRTEEKVINILEKVVASCLNTTQKHK